jgi:hypothetical protein
LAWIKEHECDPAVELRAASFANEARQFSSMARITKATKLVASFFPVAVVTFKLLGVHGFRLKKLAAVTPAHWG